MSDREPGIGWNLNHPVDMQMLADIATECDAWGDTNMTAYDVGQIIRTIIRRAQKAQW